MTNKSFFKTTKRTENTTLDLFKDALLLEDKLNKDDLIANYSSNNCKWCGFKNECNAWENKTPMYYNKNNKKFTIL